MLNSTPAIVFSLVVVLADFGILGGIVIGLSSTSVDVFSFPASILYKSVNTGPLQIYVECSLGWLVCRLNLVSLEEC